MRVDIRDKPGMPGKLATTIGDVGGDICAVDMSGAEGSS
jgi:hypothetical protein